MVSALSSLWFFVALALGIGITLLIVWSRSKNIVTKWYDWVIGTVGLLLMLVAVQHLAGSLVIEKYVKAGWLGFALFAVPALILMVITWQFIWRRNSSS